MIPPFKGHPQFKSPLTLIAQNVPNNHWFDKTVASQPRMDR